MLSTLDKLTIRLREDITSLSQAFTVLNPHHLKTIIYSNNLKRLNGFNSTESIEKQAKAFQYAGDYHWEKSSIISGFKSGWYYALAGHYFEKIEQYGRSGSLFHYAGHQFRRFGALEKGMKFYFKSADILFTHCSSDQDLLEMAYRSTRRAIGLSKESGDEEVLKNWMGQKDHFSIFVKQFQDQNPWD